jgi:L-threonylcarbamoyladenylate synthase
VTAVLRLTPDRRADPDRRSGGGLRRGGLVAFPTETVYGLGVAALDAAAVRQLFAAKGSRPTSADRSHRLARCPCRARRRPADVSSGRSAGAHRFPSPPLVPDEVTAGLDTVAVRVPAHPVAHALLAAAGIPVAAPSANLFSRPSPTQAGHVLEDLDGRIDLVLDGGPTQVGVESTVLDLSGDVPEVLRPGAVTLEMLRPLLPDVRMRVVAALAHGPQRSPGLLTKHYSPRAPLTLYEGPADRVLARIRQDADMAQAAGRRVGLLPDDDAAVMAARLYAALREFDAAGVEEIFASLPPATDGLSQAVADRLRRAAAGRVVHCA